IAHFIAELPPFQSCHEIGSGLAILPMLMALNGWEAVGIEVDRLRQAAACEVYDALRRERQELVLRCELIAGRFPDVVEDRYLDRSIAMITNFVATTSDELFKAMAKSFKRYSAILFDVDRFMEQRHTDEQRRSILARLEAEGLNKAAPALDLGDDGR